MKRVRETMRGGWNERYKKMIQNCLNGTVFFLFLLHFAFDRGAKDECKIGDGNEKDEEDNHWILNVIYMLRFFFCIFRFKLKIVFVAIQLEIAIRPRASYPVDQV